MNALTLSTVVLGILVSRAHGPARGQPSASTGADKERVAPSDWLSLSSRPGTVLAVVGEQGTHLLTVDAAGNVYTLTDDETHAVREFRLAEKAAGYLMAARRCEEEAARNTARAREVLAGLETARTARYIESVG